MTDDDGNVLVDATVPARGGSCDPARTAWIYRDKLGTADGIVKATLKSGACEIKFWFGEDGHVRDADGPDQATLVIDTPNAVTGQCGEAEFVAPACRSVHERARRASSDQPLHVDVIGAPIWPRGVRASASSFFSVASSSCSRESRRLLLWEPDEGRHALIAQHPRRRHVARRATAAPAGVRTTTSRYSSIGSRRWHSDRRRLDSERAPRVRRRGLDRTDRDVSLGAATWDEATARWAVVILATAGMFLALARFVNLDMLLTCWVTLGILAGARWLDDPERSPAWPIGVWAGLGLLTKGLIAPVLIGLVLGTTAIACGRMRRIGWRAIASVGLVTIVVAGPWYLTVLKLDPEYLRQFLIEHHLHRFLDAPESMHPKPFWFSIVMLLLAFLPWTLLLPAVIARLATVRSWDAGTRLCVAWVASVVLFFSMSSGQLGTYILPALAPLAMLTARVVRTAVADTRSRIVTAPLAVGAVVVVIHPSLWWLPHGAVFVSFASVVAVVLGALMAGVRRTAPWRTPAARSPSSGCLPPSHTSVKLVRASRRS